MIGLCLMMVLPSLALAQDRPEDPLRVEPVPRAAPEATWLSALHGALSLRYRVRWTGDDSDVDLYEYVNAVYGNAERDGVTASLSARFAEDLDGERDVSGFYAFDSRDDAYRRGSTARLLTGYVDFHRPLPGLKARAGRQILDEMAESVPMDGALLRYRAGESVRIAGFAGLPVNPFESSPSGDAMFGGWIEVVPWERGRARLEYLHLKDENIFGLFKDDLIGLSLEHRTGPMVATVRYTNLEGESRDVTARATASLAEAELVLDVQTTYAFDARQAHSYALDAYSLFLFDLEPYAQATVRASKSFGARFSLDGSLTMREIVRDGDEGIYNREFIHGSLGPHASDWPFPRVSVALSADFWKSTADDFWTAGGDISWQAHPALTVGVGTSFSLYTVDAFTGEERERVRSFYGSLRWKVQPQTTLDLRVGVDRDEFDTFATVQVGVRRAF